MTINVLATDDAQTLANTIVDEGIDISNVIYNGAATASGTFTDGLSSGIGIDEGIIITTGNANDALGPNESDSQSTVNGSGSSADLADLIFESTNDAATLEFDFETDSEEVVFNFVFASEEYNEFVDSGVNDVFGFFLNGENIALIPGTDLPVSVDNVNLGDNAEFFNSNDLDDGGPFFDIEYDGFTTVFTVTLSDLEPGTNNIQLAIADGGDSSFDSAIFIEGDVLVEIQPANPVIASPSDQEVFGTDRNEEFIGSDGNDGITGNDLDNTIVGKSGIDAIDGQAGNDIIDGGEDTDTVVYQFDAAGVTVDLSTGSATDGFGDSDVLIDIENIVGSEFNDSLTGDDNANSLTGRGGDDTIDGKGGNDFLVGAAGSDILSGGAGNDSFLFVSPTEGGDTITDFELGTDKITIVSTAFGGGLSAGSLSSAQFTIGSSATDSEQRFVFDDASGDLFFDLDGSGTASQQLIANVNSSLSASDIQLL